MIRAAGGGGANRGKDPGTDDGANPEENELDRPEGAPQLMLRVGGLPHELGSTVFGEKNGP